MAGIAGVVLKNKVRLNPKHRNSFEKMMGKLSFSDLQKKSHFESDYMISGNVIPISEKQNDHFYFSELFETYFVFEGIVIIPEEEKHILKDRYSFNHYMSVKELLSFLYDYYKYDFVNHLEGWYNLLLFDKKNSSAILVNDRLGYLPLYLYETDSVFIFASKIESILATGLIENVAFDAVSIAEHLFFNYVLSDNTFIKNISTLSPASMIEFKSGLTHKKSYWNISELFSATTLNLRDSIEVMNNSLAGSIHELISARDTPVCLSLTGGWDSRLVLSYLLKDHKDLLYTYSFGAPESPDILLPQLISGKEGFRYQPFVLDSNYLIRDFIQNAVDTIILSGGTRNYKRAHYIYAIRRLSSFSDTIVTGIYGDEVLKAGRPQGGAVISRNAINLIDSGFDAGNSVKAFKISTFPSVFRFFPAEMTDGFLERLENIGRNYSTYQDPGQKYFAFRLLLNLRKYFGNEVNSYNDFMYCYSPFISYQFLSKFSGTKFMISNYGFERPSLKLKVQSTRLYYRLTALNSKNLADYQSSRGYSMSDINSLKGLSRILYKTGKKKARQILPDGFNTKPAEAVFMDFLDQNEIGKENPLFHTGLEGGCTEELSSLIYWTSYIARNYVI